jgi:hypothetical protein
MHESRHLGIYQREQRVPKKKTQVNVARVPTTHKPGSRALLGY